MIWLDLLYGVFVLSACVFCVAIATVSALTLMDWVAARRSAQRHDPPAIYPRTIPEIKRDLADGRGDPAMLWWEFKARVSQEEGEKP